MQCEKIAMNCCSLVGCFSMSGQLVKPYLFQAQADDQLAIYLVGNMMGTCRLKSIINSIFRVDMLYCSSRGS